MDTDKLVTLRSPICVDFREGGKPKYPEKTLETQERSNAGTLSHETSPTRLGFSGESHNHKNNRYLLLIISITSMGTTR